VPHTSGHMCNVAACSVLLVWQMPSALLLLLLQVPCEFSQLVAAESTAVSPVKQLMELLPAERRGVIWCAQATTSRQTPKKQKKAARCCTYRHVVCFYAASCFATQLHLHAPPTPCWGPRRHSCHISAVSSNNVTLLLFDKIT
jgi:hypothetical protein